MKTYVLERDQWIPRSLPSVFDFFSRAENLARITPPWMHFRLRTAPPIEMRVGTQIDHSIRLAGVPMRWRSLITVWEPGRGFTDVQERGPYALWEHSHLFEEVGEGVVVRDRVLYALPLGPAGRIAHAIAVRSTLGAIFDYRYRRVREILLGHEDDGGRDGSR